jgi:hypothetical protein
MRASLLLLSLCACYVPPAENLEAPDTAKVVTAPAAPASDPHITCDMSKFSFTQESGCVNDGWVEFCAAKTGAPVVSSLRAISSDLSILEGLIGRAGCDEMNEYLLQQPLQASDCTTAHGALTPQAWNKLCALSQVPETKHFVPGWAE